MSSSASRSATNTSHPDDRLEAALGHHFSDPGLLHQALSHRSFARIHNERLEFLGDAVLGLVVAEALYHQQPEAHEDTLSLLRASLVRKETLAEVAKSLDLGEYLRLGTGVRHSGGHRLDSILADALEALIGAVHLDGGLDQARQVVLRLLGARMRNVDPETLKDAKTRLQELLQKAGLDLPSYAVVEDAADRANTRQFTVCCRVAVFDLEVTAQGRSRRAAEKHAAERMLEQVTPLV